MALVAFLFMILLTSAKLRRRENTLGATLCLFLVSSLFPSPIGFLQFWTRDKCNYVSGYNNSKEANESVGQAVQLSRRGILNRKKAWMKGLSAEKVGPRESCRSECAACGGGSQRPWSLMVILAPVTCLSFSHQLSKTAVRNWSARWPNLICTPWRVKV